MSFHSIPAGKQLPDDINVIIEIAANSSPIKYEVDKQADALFVDRFLSSPMFYPANYGYINHTLAGDGDPIDVLVISPYPVQAGAVVRARPIAVLSMSDEGGEDVKILAVAHASLTTLYEHVKEASDLPALLLAQIEQFFLHYKNLDNGKWVNIGQWGDCAQAKAYIQQAAQAEKNQP